MAIDVEGMEVTLVDPDDSRTAVERSLRLIQVVYFDHGVESGRVREPDELLELIVTQRGDTVDIVSIAEGSILMAVGPLSDWRTPYANSSMLLSLVLDTGMHLDIPAITLDSYALRINPNAMHGQRQPPPQQ